MTTPNFMDLSSRFAWFLTGMKSFRSGFPNEVDTLWGCEGDRLYHGHAFTLPYFQLRYLLRVTGFESLAVTGLKRSELATLLYLPVRPLASLLIRRAQRLADAKARARGGGKASAPRPLVDELRRTALSPDLLCHRKICISARVPGRTPA